FFVLGTLGVIGVILFLCDIYPKLEKVGGMGAVLPFCGLSAAVAGATFGAGKAAGSMKKGAVVALVELLCKVVLFGTLLCCLVSVVVYFTGFGAGYTAPYAPGGIEPSINILTFLWSFITVGVIAVITQVILMLTKIPMGIYLVCLLFLGAFLTPFGVMQAAVDFAGGGFIVLIMDAGEAIMNTFFALLSGNPMPFIYVLCLFVFLFVIGIGGGWIKMAMDKAKGKAKK
ncbi:MAG: SpoVA/SpoVAEb family sporulation membrane protein, partial [Eggerthellaceae bacterium]|nr:SpoVA/SpoVAEb family sporulation membrane protein [Eggerthellaceae bacterium]